LPKVADISVAAGEEILAVYRQDFSVTRKDDNSPLTEADLRAHRLIVAALHKGWPQIPVLSEEDADIPYATRREWSRYWLVDPLDGTREFVKKNGEFTVNIALIVDGQPVLGVVHAPVTSETYAAAVGAGATLMAGGRSRPLRCRTAFERPVVLASRSHRDARTQTWLDALPPHDTLSCGSSLKFCLIAAGTADLYPRFGPTSEWDTAAGQCVVEQAGGRVLALPERTPLRYNTKDSLINSDFLVTGQQ
jgi:3'(2'), 5'-bisphosphate nucleotidase